MKTTVKKEKAVPFILIRGNLYERRGFIVLAIDTGSTPRVLVLANNANGSKPGEVIDESGRDFELFQGELTISND